MQDLLGPPQPHHLLPAKIPFLSSPPHEGGHSAILRVLVREALTGGAGGSWAAPAMPQAATPGDRCVLLTFGSPKPATTLHIVGAQQDFETDKGLYLQQATTWKAAPGDWHSKMSSGEGVLHSVPGALGVCSSPLTWGHVLGRSHPHIPCTVS